MNRFSILPSRRTLKSTALAVSVLIAAMWGISVLWTIQHSEVRSGRLFKLYLHGGCVIAVLWAPPESEYRDRLSSVGWPRWHREPRSKPFSWSPMYERSAKDGWIAVWVPLWIPFLFVAAPMGWLWLRDRRALPGHCTCGYSFAGLAPGAPCPECGAASPSASAHYGRIPDASA